MGQQNLLYSRSEGIKEPSWICQHPTPCTKTTTKPLDSAGIGTPGPPCKVCPSGLYSTESIKIKTKPCCWSLNGLGVVGVEHKESYIMFALCMAVTLLRLCFVAKSNAYLAMRLDRSFVIIFRLSTTPSTLCSKDNRMILGWRNFKFINSC